MPSIAHAQYEWVRESRAVLFDYCSLMKPSELAQPILHFGHSSILKTLVHTADTYLYWTVKMATGRQPAYFGRQRLKTLPEVREAYAVVDAQMMAFLKLLSHPATRTIRLPEERTVTLLQLFTHVITHEFHHKGQIMSMSRLLGYTPPDTDIIR